MIGKNSNLLIDDNDSDLNDNYSIALSICDEYAH